MFKDKVFDLLISKLENSVFLTKPFCSAHKAIAPGEVCSTKSVFKLAFSASKTAKDFFKLVMR